MEVEFKIYIIITMTFVIAMFFVILALVAPQIQDIKEALTKEATTVHYYKNGEVIKISHYNRALTEEEKKQMAIDNGFYQR